MGFDLHFNELMGRLSEKIFFEAYLKYQNLEKVSMGFNHPKMGKYFT